LVGDNGIEWALWKFGYYEKGQYFNDSRLYIVTEPEGVGLPYGFSRPTEELTKENIRNSLEKIL
jgi:hypothetical protein